MQPGKDAECMVFGIATPETPYHDDTTSTSPKPQLPASPPADDGRLLLQEMRGSALAFEVAPGFKGTGTSSQALPAPSTSCSLTADLNAAVAKHTLQAIAEKVVGTSTLPGEATVSVMRGQEVTTSGAEHRGTQGPAAKRRRPHCSSLPSMAPMPPWQSPRGSARGAAPYSGLMQPPRRVDPSSLQQSPNPCAFSNIGVAVKSPSPDTPGKAQSAGGSPGMCPIDQSISAQSEHSEPTPAVGIEDPCTEVQLLRKALQAERKRADREKQKHAMLLRVMGSAEDMLRQHTDAGMSGVAAIYGSANALLSSGMLQQLPLFKAHYLANLQVRIKFEANAVLDALAQIDTLTRGQSTLTRGHQRSRAIGNSL